MPPLRPLPSIACPLTLVPHCPLLAGGRGAAAARGPPSPSLTLYRLSPIVPSWQEDAEDAVLLRHALRHGTRQWGRLVRGRQLARGNKACCNRFLFLKKKFTQKHADDTLPAQQQFQQSPAVSLSAGQPQRHMWSRPDVALQYGGLSLVECMQLFLPPGLRGFARDSPDVSPDALHGPSLSSAAHCSSINTPTSGSLPALDWPLSFSTSLSPYFASSFAPSLSPNHASTSRPYLARPLSSASQWRATTRTPFTFGLTQSSCVLHSAHPNNLPPSLHSTVPPPTAPPIAPHSPLTPPPSSTPSRSSHSLSTAPFTSSYLTTHATPLVPSGPSTIINPGPPHSLPSFPSLSALQSALHTPPPRAPSTLSDPSHQNPSQHYPSQHYPSQRYPSRSASPSNAASSASVDRSPPSSLTSSQPSSQRTNQPTESQQLQFTATAPAGEASGTSHAAAAAAVILPVAPVLAVFSTAPIGSIAPAAAAPTPLYHATMDAPLLSPSDLEEPQAKLDVQARPHKMPRMSRGVLPPATLEFARSFFSGLPAREDSQGGESSDGQQASNRTSTSARECLTSAAHECGGNAETQFGYVGGAASTGLPQMACQPEMLTAAAAAAGVTASHALESGVGGVVCGDEKRAGLPVGLFCELEDLFEENSKLL
ncbi:unnamed protein product [Closterium sp. Naga37s-1]|nr:unnamed protein product [Closterium sp. Naga37s-1]